jgi:hypothetical protein
MLIHHLQFSIWTDLMGVRQKTGQEKTAAAQSIISLEARNLRSLIHKTCFNLWAKHTIKRFRDLHTINTLTRLRYCRGKNG